MTAAITQFFLGLYDTIGATGFGVISGLITLALCLLIIPKTTDLMVDSAAGLTGKYLGHEKRTMVINASTNLPEFFSMVVAFFMLRVGGILTRSDPISRIFTSCFWLLRSGCWESGW